MEAAEKLFKDNVRHNTRLAKSGAKPRCWAHKRLLKPDDVVAILKERGLSISRRTLLDWEARGLIPVARRGSYGRSGGKWTDYPAHTIDEAVTAGFLRDVHNWPLNRIAEARMLHHEGGTGPDALLYRELLLESFQMNGGRRDV